MAGPWSRGDSRLGVPSGSGLNPLIRVSSKARRGLAAPNLGGAGNTRVKALWSKNGDRPRSLLFISSVESSAPHSSAAV